MRIIYYRFLTVVLIFSVECTSVFSLENQAKADFGTDFVQMPVTESRQIQAAQGVIDRLIPGISKNIRFEIIAKEDNLDVFELESIRGGRLVLRGSTGVALCSAFNYYLQQYCY